MARTTEIAQFLFPGRLVRQSGAVARVGDLFKDSRVPRGTIFVVVDRNVYDLGLTASLCAGLEAAGYNSQVFREVEGEPELGILKAGVEEARVSGATAVVGLGGGSALDSAKLIAYLTVSDTPLEQLSGPVPACANFPPLALIPTTVGTGSEATRIAMFSVDGVKRAVASPQFVPDFAVLDSALIAGLPAGVVAATAMDALSHALESMLSKTSNDLTWQFASKAAQTVFARLEAAVQGDSDAKSDLLYAAFLAGVALNAGVVLGHSLSYVLAARHGLPHGVGCALSLPYCLVYNRPMDSRAAAELATEVMGGPQQGLYELAAAVERLSHAVGIPTDLLSHGATEPSELRALATRVVNEYPRPTNPVPLEIPRVSTLLTYMRTGDLAGAWDAMKVNP